MQEASRPSPSKARWLRAGMWLGVAMIVVPFVAALVGIGRASSNVPEGLRGAMHVADRQAEVHFALSSTSVAAISVPLGILLLVSCGVSLVGDKRGQRLPREE